LPPRKKAKVSVEEPRTEEVQPIPSEQGKPKEIVQETSLPAAEEILKESAADDSQATVTVPEPTEIVKDVVPDLPLLTNKDAETMTQMVPAKPALKKTIGLQYLPTSSRTSGTEEISPAEVNVAVPGAAELFEDPLLESDAIASYVESQNRIIKMAQGSIQYVEVMSALS